MKTSLLKSFLLFTVVVLSACNGCKKQPVVTPYIPPPLTDYSKFTDSVNKVIEKITVERDILAIAIYNDSIEFSLRNKSAKETIKKLRDSVNLMSKEDLKNVVVSVTEEYNKYVISATNREASLLRDKQLTEELLKQQVLLATKDSAKIAERDSRIAHITKLYNEELLVSDSLKTALTKALKKNKRLNQVNRIAVPIALIGIVEAVFPQYTLVAIGGGIAYYALTKPKR